MGGFNNNHMRDCAVITEFDDDCRFLSNRTHSPLPSADSVLFPYFHPIVLIPSPTSFALLCHTKFLLYSRLLPLAGPLLMAVVYSLVR